jgi:hypothetical protein
VVRDLQTGDERHWDLRGGREVSILAWTSDAQLLVVSGGDRQAGGPFENRLLDIDSSDSLADAHRIPDDERAFTTVLGVLSGDDIAALASIPIEAGAESAPTRTIDRLVAIDARTGNIMRTLYEFPGGEWGDPGYLPRPSYDDRRFESDQSAGHFLWVVLSSAPGADVLYRFSLDDAAPTPIADGIVEAAWLPVQ